MEPTDGSGYSPGVLRRMGRAVRMGVGASPAQIKEGTADQMASSSARVKSGVETRIRFPNRIVQA